MRWTELSASPQGTKSYTYPAGCPHSLCGDCSTLAISCCSASAPGALEQNHLYFFKKNNSKYVPNKEVSLKKNLTGSDKIYELRKVTRGDTG